jgi:hypothetical protein
MLSFLAVHNLVAETFLGYTRIVYQQKATSPKLFLDFCIQSVVSILIDKEPLVPAEVCSQERMKIPEKCQKVGKDITV